MKRRTNSQLHPDWGFFRAMFFLAVFLVLLGSAVGSLARFAAGANEFAVLTVQYAETGCVIEAQEFSNAWRGCSRNVDGTIHIVSGNRSIYLPPGTTCIEEPTAAERARVQARLCLP